MLPINILLETTWDPPTAPGVLMGALALPEEYYVGFHTDSFFLDSHFTFPVSGEPQQAPPVWTHWLSWEPYEPAGRRPAAAYPQVQLTVTLQAGRVGAAAAVAAAAAGGV